MIINNRMRIDNTPVNSILMHNNSVRGCILDGEWFVSRCRRGTFRSSWCIRHAGYNLDAWSYRQVAWTNSRPNREMLVVDMVLTEMKLQTIKCEGNNACTIFQVDDMIYLFGF